MHICFLTNEYPKKGFPHGGIGSFVKTLALHLVEKGIEVTVLGINYTAADEVLIEDKVTIYRIKKAETKGVNWYLNSKKINARIDEIHKQSPIDVIESSELGLAFIKKKKDIKYIIRLHGGHHFFAEAEKRKINRWKAFQEKKSFKKADAFIAISNFVKTHTNQYLSYNNKEVALINNLIDVELFKPIETQIIKNQIVFVGTVCEKKGIRQLIQAFPLVKEKFPNATLEIYGRDWFFSDGTSYIKMLKQEELPKLGDIAKAIQFNGVVDYDEIPKKYAQAEVCAFPSHMETQGLVAPEAMAMQKMVVFTQEGPGSEIITHQETGLLCNPYSPVDIADKIIWVFSNPEKSEAIAAKARVEVFKKLKPESIVKQNIQFYEKIICS
ncbi:MAG: glycosyltransferase family 4 protein [Bacteroidota bacterium]